MTSKFDCHIYGPFFASSGVGVATRAYWRVLSAAGLRVGIYSSMAPRNSGELFVKDSYRDFLVSDLHPELNFLRINGDELSLTPDLKRQPNWNQSKKYLIPMWETPVMPAIWIEPIKSLSGIICGTDFISDGFTSYQLDLPRVTIAPQIDVDRDQIHPLSYLGLPDDRKIHLYSFSYSSWSTRKNPNAFFELAEFHARQLPEIDDLFVLAPSDKATSAVDQATHNRFVSSSLPNFRILPPGRNRFQQLSLIANSSTFISTHRSEGIGLQLAEALLLETPVVTHIFSGPRDFIDANSSAVYPYQLVEIGEGEYLHAAGQLWADPKVEEIAEALSRVGGQTELTTARDLIRQRFSIKANAEKLLGYLSANGAF